MSNTLHRIPSWLWVSWGLGLLLTLALAFDLSPWLRGDLDWRWSYLPNVAPLRIALVSLSLLVYVGLAAWHWQWALRGQGNRRAWLAVAFAIVAGVAIQFVIQYVAEPDLVRELLLRTSSPFLAGYWEIAREITNPIVYLREFPEVVSFYPVPHPQRHPPGIIMYFVLVQDVLEQFPGFSEWVAGSLYHYRCEYWPHLYIADTQFAATIGGVLSPVLGALGVVPLYGVGRHLLGRRAALGAALISPLVPGYVVWGGHWDQIFPLVTLGLLWLLYLAVEHKRHWAWWVAGGLLSVALFFTHAMLVLIAFAGFYALIHVWLAREYWLQHWRQLLVNGFGFLFGLSSVWLLYWLTLGVSYLDVYRANTEAHFEMGSSYFTRLFYNPYDFVLFLGYVLGLLALVGLVRFVRARLAGKKLSSVGAVILAFALTMLALVLSGVARAEVGRVWVFLMPLAIILAFTLASGPAHSGRRWTITALVLGAQLIVMQTTLFSDRNEVHLPRNYELADSVQPVGAQVGDVFELAGFEVMQDSVQPGAELELTLYWQGVAAAPKNYVVFTHLYDAELGAAANQDAPPRGGQYPTTCWLPDEVVVEHITLPVASDAPSGSYELIVGMYDPQADNQRLPTTGPGARDLAIVLTEIQVSP